MQNRTPPPTVGPLAALNYTHRTMQALVCVLWVLATIAGVFYGFAWRRSQSMFPAAIVHTMVDSTWHLLFPTL